MCTCVYKLLLAGIKLKRWLMVVLSSALEFHKLKGSYCVVQVGVARAILCHTLPYSGHAIDYRDLQVG